MWNYPLLSANRRVRSAGRRAGRCRAARDRERERERRDDDVGVPNTSEVLFRLCANTDPQRDSIFTKGPADVLDHATSEIAMGTKLGIDATRKLAGEGFKRPWPPLIRMSDDTRKKIDALFGKR